MDYTSALKSELFRPFTTIVIPGMLVATGWAPVASAVLLDEPKSALAGSIEESWLVNIFDWGVEAERSKPAVLQFFTDHTTTCLLLGLALCVAIGLVLEAAGSHLEQFLYRKRYGPNEDEWDRYLRLQIKDECVGQRYLRTRVVMLKFELSMAVACVLFAVGVAVGFFKGELTLEQFVWLLTVSLLGALYLGWESFGTVKVLHDARKSVLLSYGHD